MSTFTIPTIFSAIDKLTAPLKKMGAGVQAFASRADGFVGRQERLFRKLTPHFGEAQKQLLAMASAATIVGIAIGGLSFSVNAIKDYEKAVASFHTIVGNEKPFQQYQDKINEVARVTKKSSVDTALAFEKIASLNAEFAETADGIGQVAQAAITLSKASGDELGPSAESLVGIMNQFSMKADQANRTINVLAAGAGVGAASITQTSEAFVNFGSVAAGANISLEQSVGLIQTLGKFSVFGAEAGTKLRGAILKIQKAGIGYKSGQFQINDALLEAKARIDKLKTAKERDAATLKIFGAENIATGKILLANIDTFEKFTGAVTGTNQAQEQAAIRSNTLSTKIDELKAAWVNMLTGSSKTGPALESVKNALDFVARNLDTIVSVGAKVIGFFLAWKAILLASRVALTVYNIALGISSALSATAAVAVGQNAAALAAYNITTKIVTAAQWLWNAALSANPIGLVIIAVAALAAGVYALTRAYRTSNAEAAIAEEMSERVFDKTVDQQVEVIQLFEALRKAEKGSTAYSEALKRIDQIQPGLVEKYKLQEKALGNINAAEKELAKSIQKRAEAEVRAEMLKEAIKEKLTIQQEGVTFMDSMAASFGGGLISGEDIMGARMSEVDKKIAILSSQIQKDTAPIVNPTRDAQQAMNNTLEKTNNAKVDINIKDETGKVEAKTNSPLTNVKTTSTMKIGK